MGGVCAKSMAEILLLSATTGVHTPVMEGKKWVMSTCRVQKRRAHAAVWEPSNPTFGAGCPVLSVGWFSTPFPDMPQLGVPNGVLKAL